MRKWSQNRKLSPDTPPDTPARVLVVQCCHLPQFFYLVGKLRRRYPRWTFQALVTNHRHLPFYLQRFPYFEKEGVWTPDSCPPCHQDTWILFPLLNRGYWHIKERAWKLAGRRRRVDYQGHFFPLRRFQLWSSFFLSYAPVPVEFARFRRDFPRPPLGKRILLLESAHPSLIQATESRWGPLVPETAQVSRVEGGRLWQNWRSLRRQPWDSALVFPSGESGFGGLKWLPFLLRIPEILWVNEHGDFINPRPRRLVRFFWDRLLSGTTPPRSAPRILFLQTETAPLVREALFRLKETRLYPRSEILLVCREADRTLLENGPADHLLTFRPKQPVGELWRLWREIRNFDADLVCGIFTGRSGFLKQKLFYFCCGIRCQLVFNAHLDLYELGLRTWPRLWRQEPVLYGADQRGEADQRDGTEQRVLLLQTEDDETMRKALDLLRNPKVVPSPRIWVFCREDRRPLFEGQPRVEGVWTYRAGGVGKNLRIVRSLLAQRPDILAAVFSGRPVFRKHRWLFFLIPARHRLVINPHLDCFYLSRRNLSLLFSGRPPAPSFPRFWIRPLLKMLLFGPRFLFLVIWITILKLQRGYSHAREHKISPAKGPGQ